MAYRKGCYLIEYMHQLNVLAKDSPHDFALSLRSDNHAIGLCYSKDKKHWLLIDANQHSHLPIPVDDKVNEALADGLLFAFNCTVEKTTGFATQIFTTGDCNELMQTHVGSWRQTKALIGLHEHSLNVNLRAARDVTMAWLAVRNNDVALVRALADINRKACNFYQSRKDGATPLRFAAYFGHLEVVILLVGANVELRSLYGGKTSLELLKRTAILR